MKKIITSLLLASNISYTAIQAENSIQKQKEIVPNEQENKTEEIIDIDQTRATNGQKQVSGRSIRKYVNQLLEKMCQETGAYPHEISEKFCGEFEERLSYITTKLDAIMENNERAYVTFDEIQLETKKTMDLFFQRLRYAHINNLAKQILCQHNERTKKRDSNVACSSLYCDQKLVEKMAKHLP